MRAKCKRYEKYRHKRFHGGLRNDLKNSRVILTKYDVSAIRFRWPIVPRIWTSSSPCPAGGHSSRIFEPPTLRGSMTSNRARWFRPVGRHEP